MIIWIKTQNQTILQKIELPMNQIDDFLNVTVAYSVNFV